MKQYLIDYFNYNDWANGILLTTILSLPDYTEALRLFSHLISSQNKWYNRIKTECSDNELNWFEYTIPANEVAKKWAESFGRWQLLLEEATDADMEEDILFARKTDRRQMKVKLKDIVFQLNCHSVHHRAQINKLIGVQGIPVPATDFILTAISEA
jgi:uncharacterized damage-inducible protein DinB